MNTVINNIDYSILQLSPIEYNLDKNIWLPITLILDKDIILNHDLKEIVVENYLGRNAKIVFTHYSIESNILFIKKVNYCQIL